MGRRPQAGRDRKIIQGQRRDEFFRKMRRRGGTPRMPTQGMSTAVMEEPETADAVLETEELPGATATDTPVTTAEGGAVATAEDGPVASEEADESPETLANEEGATETR